jgi:predicted nucleic acid-binding protein
VSTWPVLTETCHLLLRHGGTAVQTRFVEHWAQGHFDVFDLRAGHVGRLEALMRKYSALPMDLADASLVVLAEELGRGDILSTDRRDFDSYRWKNREPFRNLLLTD